MFYPYFLLSQKEGKMSQSNETLSFAHVAQEKKCKWDKNIQYLQKLI